MWIRRTWKRGWSHWLVLPAIISAMVIGLALNIASAQDESTPESEAQIGVLDNEPVFIACDENVTAPEGSNATAIPATSPSTTFSLVAEQSFARYRAMEELANTGTNEAVGETSSIIGQLYFDENGLPLICSRFDVDMRTLVSDESRRDNFLRGNTLQTDAYPVATFVLTAVEGLVGALVDGEESSFYLVGNLSMHGVTKQVRWEATATLSGDTITGFANTTFDMADYNIESPTVGPVLSIDETITLEIDLVARKA